MAMNGISGVNTQAGQMGMNQATDSYSRNLKKQIADAKKQLQEFSSNEEMAPEEKMKKRQELQQRINDLNLQLRQHQMEQRREKQQAKLQGSVEGAEMQADEASAEKAKPAFRAYTPTDIRL